MWSCSTTRPGNSDASTDLAPASAVASPNCAEMTDWLALSDDKAKTSLRAEYVRWQAVFVRLFERLAESSGSRGDAKPAQSTVAGT